MPGFLDTADREAFEAWAARVDAIRGMRSCIEHHLCFRCEQPTMVAEWCGTVLVLSCSCGFVPVSTATSSTNIYSQEEVPHATTHP